MAAAIEPVRALGARHLPRPTAGRFRPLRAGIRNVWEYDNQEFWFAGGRLILRGANTAGKSKALELLLPFLLDGDTRPERLDPFGNRSKTMYWNLIEFDEERRYETGYCWLEFGRVADDGREEFVTTIAGLRANRGASRKVETWFAVTPLRVGHDLDLVSADGRPLPPDRFREALDGRGRFSLSARDHRAAVDQALFRLGPDRYDALIHLLLQLRRPKLSEKLDPTKLADILTDALPPLETGRLQLLAEGFTRLDEESTELEALEGSRAELSSFLGHYRNYARIHARIRSDAVRGSNSRFDDVTRVERRQREALESAKGELKAVESERAELELAEARTEGHLQGLDLSKVQHLRLVEAGAEKAEQVARATEARASADAELARQRDDDGSAAGRDAEELVQARDRSLSALGDLAGPAGMAVPLEAHGQQLRGDPSAARASLDGAARRHQSALGAVRSASTAARDARRDLDRAQERLDEAETALEAAVEEASRAASQADRAGSDFAHGVDRWAGELDTDVALEMNPGADLGRRVLATVEKGGASEEAARKVAEQLCRPARNSVMGRQVATQAEVARLKTAQDDLEAERSRIASEQDDAPPTAPGRPAQRLQGGAALWACVDFRPDIEPEQRAGLEAALHASGLLDALVMTDGSLVEPDSYETIIRPPGPGNGDARGLLAWLEPDPSSPAPAEAVADVLRGIGAGTDAPGTCWVDLAGRWANGLLSGRWQKAEAEFVGLSARAAARARRIQALTSQIEALADDLAVRTREAADLADLAARLGAAQESFPSPSALRDARRDEQRAGEQVTACTEVARSRRREFDAMEARAEAASRALAAAEEAAHCRAADVDQALAALATWREALVAAVASIAAATRAQVEAERATRFAEVAQERARESAAMAARDRRDAHERRGEADELRRTEGADVEETLARKAALERELQRTAERQRELGLKRDAVRDSLKEAETRLAATELDREQRERERAEALAALARFSRTELAKLAVGPLDGDRDLSQVTAGLAFARFVADRLGEVSTGQPAQDAASNRMHQSFVDLRSVLAHDFDPHLDTSDGLALCFAKLNGASVGASDLAAALDSQIRRRRDTLSLEERDLIERHLLDEVGSHLGDRVHAAWSQVRRMNEKLGEHPTGSGVSLSLAWDPDPDTGPGAVEALRLLRRKVELLDATERAALSAFLADRVRAARDDAEAADPIERMGAALDYRRWHRFTVLRRANGRDERFTSRTQGQGSGGEQAKLAHLPLFAATAGYYATAAATAPRLLVLDEAFAGIDAAQRADCMGMLVDLDLDIVLTNYAEWGVYPQVPSVAVYHLERCEGQRGVAALRFVWDGAGLEEDDPFLRTIELPAEGLFADL